MQTLVKGISKTEKNIIICHKHHSYLTKWWNNDVMIVLELLTVLSISPDSRYVWEISVQLSEHYKIQTQVSFSTLVQNAWFYI